ncbi:MAG: EthD family reductase [Chloroflexi bacterium]|nr:EthD family reductase [Chloroflexota bacterium]
MIRVTVLYPNSDDASFNIDYYRDSHMKMISELLTPFGLRKTGIEKGIAGMGPGTPAPFIATGFIEFDSVEEFGKGFEAHGDKIMADIPNYTNVQPDVQISEIVS